MGIATAVNRAGKTYAGMDPDFASRIQALISASGGRLMLVSGYRSIARQQQLWDAAVKKYGSAKKARAWVAPPGKSNHNHGFAADIGGAPGVSKQQAWALIEQLKDRFGLDTPLGNEPWHVEPKGHRDGGGADPDAYPTPDTHAPSEPVVDRSDPVEQAKALSEVLSGAVMSVGDMSFDEPAAADTGIGTPAAADSPGDIDRFMSAISGKESGGDYNARNSDSGAAGKFQIMPNNWGPWAKEAGLGANAARTPQNQERVARFKMQQYHAQFGGNWGAVAAAWYGGPGAAKRYLANPNDPYLTRKQGGGKYPSIAQYVRDILGGMG